MLILDNISKEFQETENSIKVEILSNLYLTLKTGETAAILGKSGSGKSTLLSIIAGLDVPTFGTLTLDGTDLTSLSEKELSAFRSEKISIVFQQFHLIPHLTALENVSLPLELTGKKSSHTPEGVLAAVGLDHRRGHYPSQMSGGEQQRVAIARALVVEPSLLLADEPTGNLDEETSEEVTQYLFKTVKTLNLSLLLVTHDRHIASFCKKQYLLQKGKLHKSTKPKKVK